MRYFQRLQWASWGDFWELGCVVWTSVLFWEYHLWTKIFECLLLGGFQSDRHKLLRPFPGELSTFFLWFLVKPVFKQPRIIAATKTQNTTSQLGISLLVLCLVGISTGTWFLLLRIFLGKLRALLGGFPGWVEANHSSHFWWMNHSSFTHFRMILDDNDLIFDQFSQYSWRGFLVFWGGSITSLTCTDCNLARSLAFLTLTGSYDGVWSQFFSMVKTVPNWSLC